MTFSEMATHQALTFNVKMVTYNCIGYTSHHIIVLILLGYGTSFVKITGYILILIVIMQIQTGTTNSQVSKSKL